MSDKKTPLKLRWNRLAHVLAFGFGSGLAPFAPGTFGTLVAVPLYWFVQAWPLLQYLMLTVVLFIIGVYICGATARDLGVPDHSGIVWDEIVGFLIAMSFAPRGVEWIAAGFVVFRAMDIIKPWPIRWVDQKVHGGFGIMLDDVLAGIYSIFILYGVQRWVGG